MIDSDRSGTPSRGGKVLQLSSCVERKSASTSEELWLATAIHSYGRIKEIEGGERKEQQGLPALIQSIVRI